MKLCSIRYVREMMHVLINFSLKIFPLCGLCVPICSVMSDFLQPHGLQPAKLLCLWDFPGKTTRVSCHFLLQGIFPTQGSNLCLLHWQAHSLPLSHQGSPLYSLAAAAAAAAKSLQSCPTLCDLIDGSPPGSPVPGNLQARTLEWVAIAFSNA